ncbi:MAG: hypothetical protein CM1200mP34_1050 [Verrucomicrobiales bacterium]|nr:MAG: hypothetical protein CM1200mP34_1050 [Verrucomicrobiales bacterium]
MYMAKHLPSWPARKKTIGDAYGQFGFAEYFGPKSQWTPRRY